MATTEQKEITLVDILKSKGLVCMALEEVAADPHRWHPWRRALGLLYAFLPSQPIPEALRLCYRPIPAPGAWQALQGSLASISV